MSIGVFGGFGGGGGCGAEAGVRIYIQQKNRQYCFVSLPSFWPGDTVTVSRSKQELGACTDREFDVGREKMNFWIYTTEGKVCVNYIKLWFLTENKWITFLRSERQSGTQFKIGTTANGIVYPINNQSRKLKI